MYPSLIKENRRMSTFNWLDLLQALGSQPVMPKYFPPFVFWFLLKIVFHGSSCIIGMIWFLILFNGMWRKYTGLCGTLCLVLW